MAAGGEILKVCAEVGGSISGEHGIGLEKADYMPLIFSEADLALHAAAAGAPSIRPASAIPARSSRAARPAARPVSRTARIRSKRRASPSASSAGGEAPRVGTLSLDKLRRIVGAAHVLTGRRLLALRRSRAARPRPWSFPARRRRSPRSLALAGGGRDAGDAVGRRHALRRRHAAAARRPRARRSSGSTGSSSTSRAISRPPSRRASPLAALQDELGRARSVALARSARRRAGDARRHAREQCLGPAAASLRHRARPAHRRSPWSRPTAPSCAAAARS